MAHEGAPINIFNTRNVFTTIVYRRNRYLSAIRFLVPAVAKQLFVLLRAAGQ
jgi:hypothetical protein